MRMSLLLGYYGPLLSERTRMIAESYYYDDLSLSEISDNEGMTRQGVLDHIRRADTALTNYEQKLGFARKLTVAASAAERIASLTDDPEVLRLCGEISAQTADEQNLTGGDIFGI
ncbi:MAG: DNA-binding protein [Clostridia bacterium]|nr:DNA-binding protein [Clostridia bacterium]